MNADALDAEATDAAMRELGRQLGRFSENKARTIRSLLQEELRVTAAAVISAYIVARSKQPDVDPFDIFNHDPTFDRPSAKVDFG